MKTYLSAQGLTVTGQSPTGVVINASGPVSAVEQAFGVTINNYARNDGTQFFSSQLDPTIPPSLVNKITAIGGLDNAIQFKAHFHPSVPLKNAPIALTGSLQVPAV